MTKAELIDALHARMEETVPFSKRESIEMVELFIETLKESIVREGKVKLSGFGNFTVRDKKARVGRNPRTTKELMIEPMRVLTFKASQVLKKALND